MGEDETEKGQKENEHDVPVETAGVFVYRKDLGNGNSQVTFDLRGGIDPLAIPSILEMAALVARNRLGLPPK